MIAAAAAAAAGLKNPMRRYIEGDSISEEFDDDDEWKDEEEDLDDNDPSSYGGYEGAPEVGMIFKNHMEVSKFYKRYGRRVGFGVSVRRSSFTPEGQCLFLELTCCKACRKRPEPKFRKRALSSTNCLARIRVKLWGDGLLHLEIANLDHNHSLSPAMPQFLNCYKLQQETVSVDGNQGYGAAPLLPNTSDDDVPLFDRFGGMGEILFRECEHLSFVERGRLRLADGDGEALRLFFTKMQAKNANFFHVVDLDEEGCVRNVFWADAWSRTAYEYYGDVVALDTTYLTSKFDLPLALLMGTNHHGHPVLLGCALLSDETVDTYVWLLKAWLASASGRLPGAVITDQSRDIQCAVAEVLPQIRHRFCLGQTMKRVSEKLGGLSEFRAISKVLQKAVFDSLRREDFEKDWLRMVEAYGLQGNEWLRLLFDCRHQWVPVYLKDTFWAGMSITHRNETLLPFFDGYVEAKTTIKMFLSQYDAALQSKLEKESQADFESYHKRRPAVSKFLMEEQLNQVYTLTIFKKFQDEIEQIMYCHATPVSTEGQISTFEVKECLFVDDGKKTTIKNHGVLYNNEEKEVQCICGSFQFRGILCRHALSVLKLQQEYEIPCRYVLDRWKKDFKKVQATAHSTTEDLVPKSSVDRYDYLTIRCLELAEVGLVSDKYQLTLMLLREVKKFLMSDKTYDDTQPKIAAQAPKVPIFDQTKRIEPADENCELYRSLPSSQSKVKKLPKEKEGAKQSADGGQSAQGVISQVPSVMPTGMNQGYIFQFVPTMPPLRPPEGTNSCTTIPTPPFSNQLGAPIAAQHLASSQQGAQPPGFIYMLPPGGADPKAFGNIPVTPWIHPQMYQSPNGAVLQPGASQKVKRRMGRGPGRPKGRLGHRRAAVDSNAFEEIVHLEDGENQVTKNVQMLQIIDKHEVEPPRPACGERHRFESSRHNRNPKRNFSVRRDRIGSGLKNAFN